jgi:hypothetical protein
MSIEDDDDRVIVVPDDLPERKRQQYAHLERRYRAGLRKIAEHLARQRGLGTWPNLPADRAGVLIADASNLVKEWDTDRNVDAGAGLTEIERIVAECRELSDQMTDLVEYVMGPQ